MYPETARGSSRLPIKREWAGTSLRCPLQSWSRRLGRRGEKAPSNEALAAPSGDRAHYSLASIGVQQGNLGLPVQCPLKTGLLGILSGPEIWLS